MAHWVRDAAYQVEAALEAVVVALGDTIQVVELLDAARDLEMQLGGDCPATQYLARQLGVVL